MSKVLRVAVILTAFALVAACTGMRGPSPGRTGGGYSGGDVYGCRPSYGGVY